MIMIRTAFLTALLVLAASPWASAQEDKALTEALTKINATGASIMPLAADSKNLRFTALNVAKDFSDAQLAAIAPVADKITSLDLARTKVTDKGLATVATFKNLTELHLENTAITDAGLDQLKSLAALEYLNLYGTPVTDAGVAKLSGLTKLKSLYLWQTKVTAAGVTALKKSLTAAHINSGWTAADDAKPVAVAPAAVAAAKPAAAPAPAKADTATSAAAGAKLDAALAAKAVVFRDVVQPILNAKCTACHGEEKSKGKLRLHTFADVMKGGSDGGNVVAGKPSESLMLIRARLPLDDDEHMAPSDEPQLSKEEIKLLEWWITEGASDSLTVAAAKKDAAVESLLAAALAKGLPKADAAPAKSEKAKPAALTEEQKKAVTTAAAKMQALGASLMPLAQDTEQQRLSVINAVDKFGDAQLAELAPIVAHLVWVDLARSKVTDTGLSTVSKMTSLERLHLENTAVTDAGIASLAGLRSLEYVNLYGTKVTDAGIAKLAEVKSLKKLFVWQTGVTKAGAQALEAKIPGLVVNVGLSEAEIAKLTAPPPAPPAPPAAAKKEAAKPATPAAKPATPVVAKPATPAAAKPASPPPAAVKPATPPAKPAAPAPVPAKQ